MLNIPVVHTGIVALNVQSCLWFHCIDDEVVIAMWAVLVARRGNQHAAVKPFGVPVGIPLVELRSVLAETLLAFLACKDLPRPCQTTRLALIGEKGRTISELFWSMCDSLSWWHWAQSNHFRPVYFQSIAYHRG